MMPTETTNQCTRHRQNDGYDTMTPYSASILFLSPVADVVTMANHV
jgi:hypothetical protein